MTLQLLTRVVPSIHDLPPGLWDEKIASGHPFKSSSFMACLEASFPERRFGYVLITQSKVPVGLAVVTEEILDFTLVMPPSMSRLAKKVRKLFPGFLRVRLGMVGTFETTLRHWWFDPVRVRERDFAEQLLMGVRMVCKQSPLLLVRDFEEGCASDAGLAAKLLDNGFVSLANLPVAIAKLDGMSIDAHFTRLKGKSRANLKNKLRQAQELGFVFERVSSFEGLIDACYPLYLQVHERAEDFRREPIPKRLFEQVATQMRGQCSLLLLRAADDSLLGFILTGVSATVSAPTFIGMDYKKTYGTPAYYVMLWKELEYAAELGCHAVDLGLTSYFVKQTLGAELVGMTMVARLESAWLRPAVQAFLPALLGQKQPARRRRFRVDSAGMKCRGMPTDVS